MTEAGRKLGSLTAAAPAIYTIPPRLPFVDSLAATLVEDFEGNPAALSDALILVPTRRATRALRDAFLGAAGGSALLLPRIRALGDSDEEELTLASPTAMAASDFNLPPAISPLRRQLLLIRLIMQWRRTGAPGADWDAAQAAALARELARFIDQVQTEGLSFDGIADLVPASYAEHWRITVDFLAIISEHWPRILADEGLMDPVERRNRLVDLQIDLWRQRPPGELVIAAGSTGSIPATARLLSAIARLSSGAVVVPGLDLDMDQESWDAIDAAHPQSGMKQLLDRMTASRDDVRPWPEPANGAATIADRAGRDGRAAIISEALRPAQTTDSWSRMDPIDAEAIRGLARIDAPGPRQEAALIALMMRETLETPGRTAALVTPDRRLARRVATEIRRWGVEIDDSAGIPLAETSPGAYLRLLAVMIREKAAPVPLLAFLKHPLAAGGLSPETFAALVRRLEIMLLRGPRPAPGLKGLRLTLEKATQDGEFIGWLEGLTHILGPLETNQGKAAVSLADLVRHHLMAAEQIAASDRQTGAARLWAGEAGEALAGFVRGLLDAADCLPQIDGASYPSLVDRLMEGQVVRPRFGRHPRLNIWGPLEARLQRADLLILGALNEGTWPAEAEAGPWLSRPMRVKFGLQPPERRIGLSAHDFAQAANAPNVVLTRAEKVDGTPTVPSRWLERLENLIGETSPENRDWLNWVDRIDDPGSIQPVKPPCPRPPIAARPNKLSVTQIETWMCDPYALFARHILKLRPLDAIDADPGAAEQGMFIHRALDAFMRTYCGPLPGDALEHLLERGREAFGKALDRPSVWSFWWPRFERIAAWFVANEVISRGQAQTVGTEISGALDLDLQGKTFTLTAKADRIDRLANGGLCIIDYKTGSLPSAKRIVAGYSPQLPLEALIAVEGAFPGVDAGSTVDRLAFWHLTGRQPAAEIKTVQGNPAELAAQARVGLTNLITIFGKPETAYLSNPSPAHAGYGDYDHLARVKEWSAGSGRGK